MWRSFGPRKKEIKNVVGSDLYSMQIFPNDFDFQRFDIQREFEKLALVEVKNFNEIPNDMITHEMQGGLYAVFLYKGLPANGAAAFEYIFTQWIPNSEYDIDQREHFEILGEKYCNTSDDSEEEIWVPVRKK